MLGDIDKFSQSIEEEEKKEEMEKKVQEGEDEEQKMKRKDRDRKRKERQNEMIEKRAWRLGKKKQAKKKTSKRKPKKKKKKKKKKRKQKKKKKKEKDKERHRQARNNTVNNSFRSMPDVLDFFCLEKSDKVQRQNIAEFVNKILAPIGACSCCDRVCYEKDMKKANQEQAQFHCIKPGDFLCPACLRTQPKTNEFCKFNPKNGLTQHEPLEPRLNWLES